MVRKLKALAVEFDRIVRGLAKLVLGGIALTLALRLEVLSLPLAVVGGLCAFVGALQITGYGRTNPRP